MNHHSEDNQSLEENDRRCWHKVNFDELNKSPENHPMGVNNRNSPLESLHENATLVNNLLTLHHAMTLRSKIKKNLMRLLPLHLSHPILAMTKKNLMTCGMILGCGIQLFLN
jgi:hypothetical protein